MGVTGAHKGDAGRGLWAGGGKRSRIGEGGRGAAVAGSWACLEEWISLLQRSRDAEGQCVWRGRPVREGAPVCRSQAGRTLREGSHVAGGRPEPEEHVSQAIPMMFLSNFKMLLKRDL